MELYLYDQHTKNVIGRLEGVLSYTDREVVTEEGVCGPLAADVELSSLPDCSETLRADFRQDNPTAEERLEELELLMAGILFGGSPAVGGEAE